MKYSIYNSLLRTRTQTVLYNSKSDGILLMCPEVERLLLTYHNNVDEIATVHSDLYKELLNNQMIVDDNIDESDSVIKSWELHDCSKEKFSIVINPTLDCNLRCWYCYEEHNEKSIMNGEILASLQKLIISKLECEELKTIHLHFFGGEPLLAFHEVMEPILMYAKDNCARYTKTMEVGITTNGTLFTDDVILRLSELCNPSIVNLQITIDGNRRLHNAIRRTKDGIPTFDTIINNIKKCAKIGFNVHVRFNYTHRNINSLAEISHEFLNAEEDWLRHISFSFHKVWQEPTSKQIEQEVTNIEQLYREKCLKVMDNPRYQKYRCYADKSNHIVVNYNGDLYKCTARDFTKENREGVIGKNGELMWNKKYKKRMDIVYGNATCRNCSIFPICGGYCSQAKLEHMGDGCIMRYTNDDRERIVAERVKLLLGTI